MLYNCWAIEYFCWFWRIHFLCICKVHLFSKVFKFLFALQNKLNLLIRFLLFNWLFYLFLFLMMNLLFFCMFLGMTFMMHLFTLFNIIGSKSFGLVWFTGNKLATKPIEKVNDIKECTTFLSFGLDLSFRWGFNFCFFLKVWFFFEIIVGLWFCLRKINSSMSLLFH